jgi:hypothetical protein
LHAKGASNGYPLLLPSGKLTWVGGQLFRQPDSAQELLGALYSCRLIFTLHTDRPDGYVLQCRHVREQVEVLEDHADVGAPLADLPVMKLVELPSLFAVPHQFAVDSKAAGIDLFEVVDTAQESRFAGA